MPSLRRGFQHCNSCDKPYSSASKRGCPECSTAKPVTKVRAQRRRAPAPPSSAIRKAAAVERSQPTHRPVVDADVWRAECIASYNGIEKYVQVQGDVLPQPARGDAAEPRPAPMHEDEVHEDHGAAACDAAAAAEDKRKAWLRARASFDKQIENAIGEIGRACANCSRSVPGAGVELITGTLLVGVYECSRCRNDDNYRRIFNKSKTCSVVPGPWPVFKDHTLPHRSKVLCGSRGVRSASIRLFCVRFLSFLRRLFERVEAAIGPRLHVLAKVQLVEVGSTVAVKPL